MTQINEENKQIMLTQIDNDEQLYNNIFPTLTNLIQDLWKQRINAVSISETAKLTTTKPITEPTIKPTIEPLTPKQKNKTTLIVFAILAVIIIVLIVVFVLLYLKHKKKTNKKV